MRKFYGTGGNVNVHELTVFLPVHLIEYANKRAEEMDVSVSSVVALALQKDAEAKERMKS